MKLCIPFQPAAGKSHRPREANLTHIQSPIQLHSQSLVSAALSPKIVSPTTLRPQEYLYPKSVRKKRYDIQPSDKLRARQIENARLTAQLQAELPKNMLADQSWKELQKETFQLDQEVHWQRTGLQRKFWQLGLPISEWVGSFQNWSITIIITAFCIYAFSMAMCFKPVSSDMLGSGFCISGSTTTNYSRLSKITDNIHIINTAYTTLFNSTNSVRLFPLVLRSGESEFRKLISATETSSVPLQHGILLSLEQYLGRSEMVRSQLKDYLLAIDYSINWISSMTPGFVKNLEELQALESKESSHPSLISTCLSSMIVYALSMTHAISAKTRQVSLYLTTMSNYVTFVESEPKKASGIGETALKNIGLLRANIGSIQDEATASLSKVSEGEMAFHGYRSLLARIDHWPQMHRSGTISIEWMKHFEEVDKSLEDMEMLLGYSLQGLYAAQEKTEKLAMDLKRTRRFVSCGKGRVIILEAQQRDRILDDLMIMAKRLEKRKREDDARLDSTLKDKTNWWIVRVWQSGSPA